MHHLTSVRGDDFAHSLFVIACGLKFSFGHHMLCGLNTFVMRFVKILATVGGLSRVLCKLPQKSLLVNIWIYPLSERGGELAEDGAPIP